MELNQSPDFVSLSPDAVADIRRHASTWVEWKILRQYQMLFGEGLDRMKDLCYLIAINTRRLGEARGGVTATSTALDLSIKFFNTYLRATINANGYPHLPTTPCTSIGSSVSSSSSTPSLNLEDLILDEPMTMTSTMTVTAGTPAGELEELERRGLDDGPIHALLLATSPFGRKMTFITEVIAHDVGHAVRATPTSAETTYHDQAPRDLPARGRHRRVEAIRTTRPCEGVRRAQVKLADHLPRCTRTRRTSPSAIGKTT